MGKVQLTKIEHRGQVRIQVDFPYDPVIILTIKSIKGYKWSQSKKCWHFPYTKESYALLQEHFEVSLTSTDKSIATKTVSNSILDKQITSANKELLKRSEDAGTSAESSSIPKENEINQDKKYAKKIITGSYIIIEKKQERWLKAFVPYDKKGWINIVKDIPGRKWDTEEKCWLIPYVQDSLKRLSSLVGQEYLQYTFEIDTTIPKVYYIKEKRVKRKSSIQLNALHQKALVAFEEKLLLENKARRTRKTYKNLFVHFLAYFSNTKPSSISKAQIEQYIIYKRQDHISDSQLNQIINCLNCFFIRILNQEDKVIKLERPKKKRKLPNVFSLEEMELLLKSTKNLKHKSMLILIYSGGLRRSEVLNLSVEDLNFNRKTLFIKNAKGGKDRYTFFSDTAQKYLKEYLNQYQPKYYLFEGQTGGRYSETSLQSIYEKAKKTARLSGNITLHGLRHSFATHMVEKGVPLHVVQDLLGHSSIKTTEIYLHISNKFRKELKSPLDDLNI